MLRLGEWEVEVGFFFHKIFIELGCGGWGAAGFKRWRSRVWACES